MPWAPPALRRRLFGRLHLLRHLAEIAEGIDRLRSAGELLQQGPASRLRRSAGSGRRATRSSISHLAYQERALVEPIARLGLG